MVPKEKALEMARVALQKCSTPHGMHASGGKGGYNMVFSRDSMIGLIGASVADSKNQFKSQFRITLDTLGKNQSMAGQIPNAVDNWDSKRKKQSTFATIDSTLWWLLGMKAYASAYKDSSILRKKKKEVDKAFFWLLCQDTGEDGLPEQHPTSDWQDCFPHKYGHTINSVALYYSALKLFDKTSLAKKVKAAAMGESGHLSMFNEKLGYFFPWRWKGHDGITEQETWFDSLGNVLAVCGGLAGKAEAESILDFVEAKGLDKPYPIRAIYPPIRRGTKEWQDYFSKCLAAKPNYYINGGIWPYIGGFYVTALVKAKRFEKAEHELEKLLHCNELGVKYKWEFNEWVHPITKKAGGSSYHAWSAGTFILASKSVAEKKVPFF